MSAQDEIRRILARTRDGSKAEEQSFIAGSPWTKAHQRVLVLREVFREPDAAVNCINEPGHPIAESYDRSHYTPLGQQTLDHRVAGNLERILNGSCLGWEAHSMLGHDDMFFVVIQSDHNENTGSVARQLGGGGDKKYGSLDEILEDLKVLMSKMPVWWTRSGTVGSDYDAADD